MVNSSQRDSPQAAASNTSRKRGKVQSHALRRLSRGALKNASAATSRGYSNTVLNKDGATIAAKTPPRAPPKRDPGVVFAKMRWFWPGACQRGVAKQSSNEEQDQVSSKQSEIGITPRTAPAAKIGISTSRAAGAIPDICAAEMRTRRPKARMNVRR